MRWASVIREEVRCAHLALTFLTVLPLPRTPPPVDGRFARATGYYPLAGYVVGGLSGLLLLLPLDPGVRAALALATWWLLTGLVHLDGVIDSADALLAPVPPQRRLEILRDVHVGAFGVVAGCLVTVTAWAALAAAPTAWAPLLAAVVARTVLLGPLHWHRTARPGGMGDRAGQADPDGGSQWPVSRWVGAAVLAAPTLLLPWGWLCWLVGLLAVGALSAWAAGRLGGGLTGDTYGLLIVLVEIAVLVTLSTTG